MQSEAHSHPHTADVFKAIGSTASMSFGVITSFQSELEWWLRVSALLLGGIIVPAVTAFSIWRKNKGPHP